MNLKCSSDREALFHRYQRKYFLEKPSIKSLLLVILMISLPISYLFSTLSQVQSSQNVWTTNTFAAHPIIPIWCKTIRRIYQVPP